MATASTPDEVTTERRVFIGDLPPDVLRISATSQQQQEAADQQTALAIQQQMIGTSFVQNLTGKLNITVAKAMLYKNYGMTRMDPYVRIRIGHCVYETHTDLSGGKYPSWNKVIQCLLPEGVNSVYLEIYDECSFTMDELIAWAEIPIPEAVFNGETLDEWYPVHGKQYVPSPTLYDINIPEGKINLVLSYSIEEMFPNMDKEVVKNETN